MKLTYMKNGATLSLDREACTGCGACVNVCPHAVFILDGGKAEIASRETCMECGACAKNCPVSALAVNPGVGCAAAIIIGKLKGTKPTCGEGCCGEQGQDRCC